MKNSAYLVPLALLIGSYAQGGAISAARAAAPPNGPVGIWEILLDSPPESPFASHFHQYYQFDANGVIEAHTLLGLQNMTDSGSYSMLGGNEIKFKLDSHSDELVGIYAVQNGKLQICDTNPPTDQAPVCIQFVKPVPAPTFLTGVHPVPVVSGASIALSVKSGALRFNCGLEPPGTESLFPSSYDNTFGFQMLCTGPDPISGNLYAATLMSAQIHPVPEVIGSYSAFIQILKMVGNTESVVFTSNEFVMETGKTLTVQGKDSDGFTDLVSLRLR